jgi:antitoxin ParD1/3/4
MPMPSSYSIGSHFEKFVGAMVETGRYNSEVIRAGLRLLEEQEAHRTALFRSLDEAIRDIEEGRGIAAEEAFAEVRARIRRMGKERESLK